MTLPSWYHNSTFLDSDLPSAQCFKTCWLERSAICEVLHTNDTTWKLREKQELEDDRFGMIPHCSKNWRTTDLE